MIAALLAAFTLWFYLLAIVIPRCQDWFEVWLWKRLGDTGPIPDRDE